MKRIVCWFMVLVLAFTVSGSAFAANGDDTSYADQFTVNSACIVYADGTQEDIAVEFKSYDELVEDESGPASAVRYRWKDIMGSESLAELSNLLSEDMAVEDIIFIDYNFETYRKLQQEGAKLSVNFSSDVPEETEGRAIYSTVDDVWNGIGELTQNEDGSYTVECEEAAVFLIAIPFGGELDLETIKEENKEVTIPVDDTGKVVPSVVSKNGVVVLRKIILEDGQYYAEFNDGNDAIIVTNYAEREEEDIGEINYMLNEAFKSVTEADSLTDVASDLEAVVKSISESYDPEEFVIRDLFDVYVTSTPHGTWKDLLDGSGHFALELVFAVDLLDTEDLIVIYNCHGSGEGAEGDDQWKTIPNDRVIRNEDGTLSVVFEELCPVAFLVRDASEYEGETVQENDTPASTSTGETETVEVSTADNGPVLGIIACALVAAGAGAVALLGKKKAD